MSVVKLGRSTWNTPTWVCSLVGHVVPAAFVTTLRPTDEALGRPAGDDDRLVRCLRCDGWILTRRPIGDEASSDVLPDPINLPKPKRGKALSEQVVTRVIAIERGLHVVFFLAVFVLLGVVQFGLPGLREEAQTLLVTAQGVVGESRPGQSLLVKGLQELGDLNNGRVLLLMLAAGSYALLEGVEALFLWRGKRWAEYLTVLATAVLLPITISALIDKVSTFKVLGLIVEIAILAYLVLGKRLFGVRGGQKRLDANLAADVDWEEIYRTPPVAGLQHIDRRQPKD